ncbi:hypothetical protein CJF42_14910 [Pseudoalteromonas sp. NBT06-2]|uniref:hypothetical protein n=1 Tax=Pseudoalteromonas sp. NBT06-2 TaxID=2025950 RepID=UPI000BA7A21E|nr:hypothetical protein [Pseudoalteromonas sp. NBT06-2]PAJ73630.1 hypothetical protein CJF42_14910 [Pseudoalteromonas sp. NBT06-2]
MFKLKFNALATSTILTIASISSFNAFAGDDNFGEKTNCRYEITGYKNIYAGAPECQATYQQTTCKPKPRGFDLITETITKTLSDDYRESTKKYVSLGELVSYYESKGAGPSMCTLPEKTSEYISCTATLDFLEQRPVKEYICDYKPVANSSVREDNEHVIDVAISAADSDGSIASVESWVDGVYKGNAQNYFHYHGGASSVSIRVKAIDNHGYIYDSTATHRITGNGGCNGEYC